MKKFCLIISFLLLYALPAAAVNMVVEESYFDVPLEATGLPDYPPFSRYLQVAQDAAMLESAFLKPTIDIMEKHKMRIYPEKFATKNLDVDMLLLEVRSGKIKLFLGAYADTQKFKGLQLIFPASISNPIHLITTPEMQEKIKSMEDLKAMRGVVSKTEFLSDFVHRKVGELNVQYTETPFEAYEKVITGQADYMIGSLYYNRMTLSHYGLNDFLTYSKKPLFKIPVFIAISKVTPRLSQYLNAFREEFSKPEYAQAVKEEIIRMINAELEKYDGTVPPSFAKHDIESDTQDVLEDDQEEKKPEGHIIEQKIEEKTIDDVLEGI